MISTSIWEMLLWLFLICIVGFITLSALLSHDNIPSRSYRSLMRKYISLWMGLILALIYKFSDLYNDDFPPIREVWHLVPNGSIVLQSNHTMEPAHLHRITKPVIFITTTDYSPIQSAVLTRLAQALYPVRDFVQWIVVSLPIETSRGHGDQVLSTSRQLRTFGEAIQKNPELAKAHHRKLNELLGRFGIPYVLLNSNKMMKTFWGGGLKSKVEAEDRLNLGYQTGLFWAVKFLTQGVILIGNEHFAYNSMLFNKLRKTKIASCWTIGLYPVRASVPPTKLIFNRYDNPYQNLKVVGYNDGLADRIGNIIIERGGFAMDLQYLRDNIPFSDHWKLAHDKQFTTDDIKLDVADIQVFMNEVNDEDEESKILVWRTYSTRPIWPNTLNSRLFQYVSGDNNSNLNALLTNVYGPRFHFMKNAIRKKESNRTFVKDYDF